MAKRNIDDFEWVGDPKQMLITIINNLPHSVFWKDAQLVYRGANRKFSKFAGLGLDDQLVDKDDYDLSWKKEEADFFRLVDQKVMSSNQPERNIIEPQLRADGTEAWIDTTKIPLTDEFNRVIGVLGMFQDVTPVKQAEKDKQKLIHELRSKNISLQETMDSLMKAQGQLIISEKMATMGQLISRVAHEVNTPMGVIKAHAESMADQFRDTIKEMPIVYRSLSDQDLELFNLLVEKGSLNQRYVSPREERVRRKELEIVLNEFSIVNSAELIYFLVDLDLNKEDVIDFLPLLKSDQSFKVLKLASYLALQQKSYKSTQEAVDKASQLIKALKTYAKKDAQVKKEPIDIVKNIESVLVLFSNHVKHGVHFDRKYDVSNEFFIDGYNDSLAQVWINLIQNAIDAMDEKGLIQISIEEEEEYIVVGIEDSGCGIRAENHSKIFKPFFSTKKKTEGIGLGLDIVSNIVKQHEGIISLESVEGKGTEFFIRLKKI